MPRDPADGAEQVAAGRPLVAGQRAEAALLAAAANWPSAEPTRRGGSDAGRRAPSATSLGLARDAVGIALARRRARRSRDAADVAGMRSGIRSRGGIGVPPRTTTIERNRSSTCAAASASTAASPRDHAAQEPARAVDADEAGEAHVPGWPSAAATGISASSSGPNGPSRSLDACRPAARSGRRSARGSRARGRSCAERRTAAPAASSPRSRGRRRRCACVPSSTSRRRWSPSRGRILTPPRST